LDDASRYLFLAGGLPFAVLGLAHALATPLRPADRKGLAPSDPALAEAMSRGHVRMTRRTDLWRCWVGFNLSHSLGAVAFGAFVLAIGRSGASYESQAAFAGPLAVAVSGAFLGLAVRYWFRTPIVGCAFSFACFALAWAARLAGGRGL
jgi:hypothetical protein